VFTTADDNQPSVEIHVLQGEREMGQFNKTLGKFQLVDLPPSPRGVPQIEVTFDIDANGIVHVSAKDRATGTETSITITGQSSMDKDAIDQMIKDAESHADEDKARKEEAEIRNNADTLVYSVEKQLSDNDDKISEDEKSAVEGKLAAVKEALDGEESESIKITTDALSEEFQQISQRLYEAAAQEAAEGEEAPAGEAAADDIVDAEIVEEDE
jgi:molecular chaperone DnaK